MIDHDYDLPIARQAKARISRSGVAADNLLRPVVFQSIREDKPAREVVGRGRLDWVLLT